MKRWMVVVVAALGLVVGVLAGVVWTRADDAGRTWPSRMMAGRGGHGFAPGKGWSRHTAVMRHGVVRSELDYLTQMIPHHEEAIAAARELQRSGRAELRQFGSDIVRTQTRQVTRMKQFLSAWYPGRDTEVDYEPMMRDLSGLSGDRLDRAFLEEMVPHHMAAVMMSQQLLVRGLARHDAAAGLAESIRDGQHAEIFRMQHWLTQWYDDRGAWGPRGPGMMW